MSANIGIEVWFACKSCNTSFLKLRDFIQHKKKDHFDEFKNIRCIVLEERTVSTLSLDSGDENDDTLENCIRVSDVFTSKQETEYVSDSVEISKAVDDPFQGIDNASLNPATTSICITTAAEYQSNLSPHLNPDADADAASFSYIHDDYESTLDSDSSNVLPHHQLSHLDAQGFRDKERDEPFSVGPEAESKQSQETSGIRKIIWTSFNETKNPCVTIKRLTKNQIQNVSTCSRSEDPPPIHVNISDTREIKTQFLKKFESASVPVHLQSDPNFECKLCHIKFVSDLDLIAHLDICWFDNKNKHYRRYCVPCNKLFNYPSALKEHLLRFHMTEAEKNEAKKIKCPDCPMKFFKRVECRVHMESHKRKEDRVRSFVCLICGTAFYKNHQLTQHYKTHSDQRPFNCPESDCNKAFSSNFGLKEHVFYMHNSTVRYKCPVPNCSVTLKYRHDIARHVRIHTGERRHKCLEPNCDQSFLLPSQLTRHKINSHF